MKVIKKYDGKKEIAYNYAYFSVNAIIYDFINSSQTAIYINNTDNKIYIRKYKGGLLSKIFGRWSWQMIFIPNYLTIENEIIKVDDVIKNNGFFFIEKGKENYLTHRKDVVIYNYKQVFYKELENYHDE